MKTRIISLIALLSFSSACNKSEKPDDPVISANSETIKATESSSDQKHASSSVNELSRQYALEVLQKNCTDIYGSFSNVINPIKWNAVVSGNPGRELSSEQQALVDAARSRLANMERDGWIDSFSETRDEVGNIAYIALTATPSNKMNEMMVPSDEGNKNRRYLVGKKCPGRIDGIINLSDSVAEVQFFEQFNYNGLAKYFELTNDTQAMRKAIFKKFDDGWRFESLQS